MKLELSRDDINVLKGMGILCIILHNFLHFLPFTVHECEYTFDYNKGYELWSRIVNINSDLFADFLSYFGHYGVAVFLFASGYGLVMKHEYLKKGEPTFLKFMSHSISKLFKLMIIAYLVFILVDRWNQSIDSIHVVAQLTFIGNLFRYPFAYPGPYWYFSLTLQLYILYYLVLRHIGKKTIVFIVVISCALQMYFINDFYILKYIRFNFMGSVLPFSMGVWAARYGLPLRRWFLFPILLIIAVLVWGFLPMVGHSSDISIIRVSGYSWVIIPYFVTYGYICLQKSLPRLVSAPFMWIGGISAAVFATHPIIRSVIMPLTDDGNYKITVLIYLVVCLVVGYLYNLIQKLI
jgi:peptidoglycan/LPS O-acetylase OafA/YrhL